MVKNNSRRRSVSRRERVARTRKVGRKRRADRTRRSRKGDSRRKDLVRTRRNSRTSKPKRQSGGVKTRSTTLKSRDKSRRSVIKKTRRLNSRSTRVTRKTIREAVPETINLFGNTIINTLNTIEPFRSQHLPLINAKPGPGIDSAYSVVNALYLIGKGWCAAAVDQSVRVVVKILTCVFIQITDSIIQSLSKRFRHPKLAKLLKNAWLVAKWTVGVMGVAAPVMVQLPDAGGRASYVDTQFLCALDYLNEIRERMLEDGNSLQTVLDSGYSDAITQACVMYYNNSVSETVRDYNAYIQYIETHPSTQGLVEYIKGNEQLADIRRSIEGIAAGLSTAAQHRPAIAIEKGLPDPIPESDDEPFAIGGMLSSPPDSEVLTLVPRAREEARPYKDPAARPPVLKDTRYVPARRRGMAGIAKKLNDLVEINERCQHTDYPVDVWNPDKWFGLADKTYLKGMYDPPTSSRSVLAIEDKKPSSSKKKKKSKKKSKKTSSNSEALQI